jgi:hypothetical protein
VIDKFRAAMSRRPLIFTSLVLFALALILYIALEVSVAHEQALSPGEKSLGVAVLGMIFGIPMFLSAATGTVLLAFTGLRALYRELVSN